MLFDILRFNLFSPDLLTVTDEDEQNITLGDYLDREGYSEVFRRDYILPIAIAWNGSPGVQSALRIPAVSLVRVMRNQNMLRSIWGEETTWLTLKEGAKNYIDVLVHGIPKWQIHLSTPVKEVGTRKDGKPYLKIIEEEAGECEFQYLYDHIIIATPGDEALRLLGSRATVKEKEILSAFKTTKNKVVLHSDLDHMPALKETWAAWNYLTTTSARTGGMEKVELTYNLNILHHLRRSAFGDVLATLNPIMSPAKKSIQGVYQYDMPVNTQASLAARKRIEMEIQNKRGISFAGAWLGWGSYEDGCASGLKAAQRLGAMMPWEDGRVVDSNTVRTPTRPQPIDWIMGLVRMVVWVLSVWVSVVEGLMEGINDVRKQTVTAESD
jgi:predicted NAD/FAD-binding protein